MNMRKYTPITTIIKFGLAALAIGAFFEASLPAKAGQLVWVRAQQLDYFKVRGLVPPGSYSKHESRKPTTIAVRKSGQGVGAQKQATSKFGRKNAQHVSA
jgi:hypothetical protein